MWIFTKHGFYSAVCARQGDGRYGQAVDPNRIMVRARVHKHLDALKERFAGLLRDCEIQEFPGSDYAYRIFVDKPVWSQVLVGLNEELDYDNFKSEVADFQGDEGTAYEHSLHKVWSVMNRLQEGEMMVEQPPELSQEDEEILDRIWDERGKESKSSLVQPLFDGPLDIIGDVHGEIDALQSLLGHLGYDKDGNHPQGRRLVFVGDLTDRGPDSPAVVDLVSTLMKEGKAQCVLGNHDLNILLGHPKHDNNWFFGKDYVEDGIVVPQALADKEIRSKVLDFFRTLPIALERNDLRVIHACWNDAMIDIASKSRDVVTLYHEQHKLIEGSFPELDSDDTERDLAHQNRNPVKLLSSGPEERTEPFHASGKLRKVGRVQWWKNYQGIFCVFGHYSILDGQTRGNDSTFCIDYGVARRWTERREGRTGGFRLKLGALRWPERVVVFDEGEEHAV